MLALGRLKAKLLAPAVRSIFSHLRRVAKSYPNCANHGMLFSTNRPRSAANRKSAKDTKDPATPSTSNPSTVTPRVSNAAKQNQPVNIFDIVNEQLPTREARDEFVRKLGFGNKLINADDNRLALPYPPGVDEEFWGTSERPPFWDGYNAIVAILNHAFTIDKHTRPPALICTTASGYGKTRLLAEWGIRALQSPAIIHAFLNNKTPVDTKITTPVIDQLERAKKDIKMTQKVIFLVRLHQTLSQQRVLYGFANRISTNGDQLSIHGFMQQNLDRFKGLKLQEPSITISRHALRNKDDIELLEIFDQCVATSNPEYIPLVQIEGFDMNDRMTLIIIDECQDFLSPDFDSKCTTNSKAHQTLTEFALYARTLKTKFFVTLGGTRLGNLEYLDQDISKYRLLCDLPLNPLLSCSYLAEVCQKQLDCELATTSKQLATTNTLSFFLSTNLYKRWVYCCGVPRTIEHFAKALVRAKEKLRKGEKQFLQAVDSVMQYPKTKLHSSLVGDTREKLLVEAAFCLPKQPLETIGSTEVTYEMLEACGALIPYTFPETKSNSLFKPEEVWRNYTMPFYYFPEELMDPILSFSQFSIPDNLGINYECIPITLQTVLQSFENRSDSEANYSFKTELLEDSAAVTLWLRYKLVVGTSAFPSVPLNQIIILEGTTGLDGCWKGVIKLIGKLQPQLPNFQSTLDIIKQNHLIVVNEDKSGFADVIVPLYKGETFAKFMLIQCHNVAAGQTKISPSALHRELKELIKQHSSDLFVVLSPNIPPVPLSTRTAKNKEAVKKELLTWEDNGQIAVHNGDGWLSPWFVHTFREISETKWLI